ncbi:MAG: GNAT family N-acetyltransferase [Bacteroidetes bacterium]|nr:GNAT family N-acetyltransferase [Fibrella sp.]
MCVLQTNRLSLHQLSTQDAPFILELLNTPGWLAFIGDRGVKTLDDARTYILNGPVTSYAQHGFGLYLVELTESRLPIGLCGLLKRETVEDVDIGFAFLPPYTGQGYAYEAASAMLTYARTMLHLKRVVAITAPGNQRSISLLERLGMRYKATITLAGNTEESILYEIG